MSCKTWLGYLRLKPRNYYCQADYGFYYRDAFTEEVLACEPANQAGLLMSLDCHSVELGPFLWVT